MLCYHGIHILCFLPCNNEWRMWRQVPQRAYKRPLSRGNRRVKTRPTNVGGKTGRPHKLTEICRQFRWQLIELGPDRDLFYLDRASTKKYHMHQRAAELLTARDVDLERGTQTHRLCSSTRNKFSPNCDPYLFCGTGSFVPKGDLATPENFGLSNVHFCGSRQSSVRWQMCVCVYRVHGKSFGTFLQMTAVSGPIEAQMSKQAWIYMF